MVRGYTGSKMLLSALTTSCLSHRNTGREPESHGPKLSRRVFLGAAAAIVAGGVSQAWAENHQSVKVGCIFPEQGPYAAEAQSLVSGFLLYLKENAATAPKIELLFSDPAPDESRTLETLADLVMQKKVPFLILPPSSSVTEKVIHAISGEKVVVFVTAPTVRFVSGEKCSPTMFRVGLNSFLSAQPLAPWALRNIGLKVFITGDDISTKNEEADAFAYGIERFGGSFVDRIMIRPGSDDLEKVLKAIEASNADFVFAALEQQSVQGFVDAYRSRNGIRQPLLGPESLLGFPYVVETLGKRCAGIRSLGCVKDPQGLSKRIRDVLKRNIGNISRAAEGYDLAALVCQAVTAMPDVTDPLQYARVIQSAQLDGPRGKIQFDQNNEPIVEMFVQEWIPEDGAKDRAKGKDKESSKPNNKKKAKGFKHVIVAELGICRSLDFGCGRVGFPKTAEPDKNGEMEEVGPDTDLFMNEE